MNGDGEIVEVVEKPAEPPSNLAMTGFHTFTFGIFQTCYLVQPWDRGWYELPDAIDLLIQSGRTIDAVRMEGWRVDVGYPEDRERTERLLNESEAYDRRVRVELLLSGLQKNYVGASSLFGRQSMPGRASR